MNTHVMLDLETLGRGPGCRILSIGAVLMTAAIAEAESSEFYLELDPNNQPGLSIDQDTWSWWQQQEPAVRDRLFNNEGKVGLLEGLKAFGLWLSSTSTKNQRGDLELCVWGNGSDFDNAILKAAYEAAGLPLPWPYWGNRCYRTLKGLAPDLKLVRLGAHHNALDDARSQAAHAAALFQRLGLEVHDL